MPEAVYLKKWIQAVDGGAAPKKGIGTFFLPGVLQACTQEVLLGKIYASSGRSTPEDSLHTWVSAVDDPNGMEAAYTAEVHKQPGGGKFKYCIRFKASKGSILLIEEVKACVVRARRGCMDEELSLTQHSDDPHCFNFSTTVHCRRELDIRISYLILLKADAPADSELDYRPPSTSVLFHKRQETADLTLTAADVEGVKSSFPVHSAVLKLCCSYFETALGDR